MISVVIEGSDALRNWYEMRTAFSSYVADKLDDCPFVCAFIPGREWIGLS